MLRNLTYAAMALVLTLAPCALAQEATTSTAQLDEAPTTPPMIARYDPDALDWLKKIEEKHQTIQRVVAEFDQVKMNSLFLEEIRSIGILRYIKPDRLMIVYNPPEKISELDREDNPVLYNYLIGDVFWVYNPSIKQADKFYLKHEDDEQRRINEMLIGFGASVEQLKAHFRIAILPVAPDGAAGIRFVPLPENEDRLFKSMELYISKKELRPLMFHFVDSQSDDETTVTIKNVLWNVEVDEKLFELDFPRDVEIIERN
ncbi:outer membrane lipoprotein carrier protein LolA [Candidatus Sumerlaeota bacterium]|nr:outer membrane lipoprotein carrier protein LolA [Candidatus Sumerlaeota bacterium]